MTTDVYSTVKSCSNCVRLEAKSRHQRRLELFSPSGPLEFAVVDILGPLLRTRSSTQLVITIAERYSRLTRAAPTTKYPSNQVANIIFKNCAIPYDTLVAILFYKGQKFVSKFLRFMYTYFGLKNSQQLRLILKPMGKLYNTTGRLDCDFDFMWPTTNANGTSMYSRLYMRTIARRID